MSEHSVNSTLLSSFLDSWWFVILLSTIHLKSSVGLGKEPPLDSNAEEDVFKVYMKDYGLEVDFVMRYKGRCTLVEVKAVTGNTKSTKTILHHPEKYRVDGAVRQGDYNVGRTGQILMLPLYMAFLLREH